jgi:hypothetical protein
MNKTVKIIVVFLLVDILALGGYFVYKSLRGGKGNRAESAWVMIDENFVPTNAVEEFIKTDAANRQALPIYIRNYGRDAKVLRRFKGKRFAQVTENILSLFFKGLDDLMIVGIKYKTENEREVVRTMLYVLDAGQWKVGDTGTIVE